MFSFLKYHHINKAPVLSRLQCFSQWFLDRTDQQQHITWALIRNANTGTSPRNIESETQELKPSKLCFIWLSRLLQYTWKFENHWF